MVKLDSLLGRPPHHGYRFSRRQSMGGAAQVLPSGWMLKVVRRLRSVLVVVVGLGVASYGTVACAEPTSDRATPTSIQRVPTDTDSRDSVAPQTIDAGPSSAVDSTTTGSSSNHVVLGAPLVPLPTVDPFVRLAIDAPSLRRVDRPQDEPSDVLIVQRWERASGEFVQIESTLRGTPAAADWFITFHAADGPMMPKPLLELTSSLGSIFLSASNLTEKLGRIYVNSLVPASTGSGWELAALPPDFALVVSGRQRPIIVSDVLDLDAFNSGAAVEVRVVLDAPLHLLPPTPTGEDVTFERLSIDGIQYARTSYPQYDMLAWLVSPGVVAVVLASERAREDLIEVAQDLRVLSMEEWNAIPRATGDGCVTVDC